MPQTENQRRKCLRDSIEKARKATAAAERAVREAWALIQNDWLVEAAPHPAWLAGDALKTAEAANSQMFTLMAMANNQLQPVPKLAPTKIKYVSGRADSTPYGGG